MRVITLKYPGECRKCGAKLAVGEQAIYERRVGVFCIEHEPTDAEEIRAYRQEGADRRADRLDGWAAKRKARAEATFKQNERFTGDIAFNTQPGHIPLRARIIRQERREFESLKKAERMEQKAENIRQVQVKGDAERKRQAKRESVLTWLKIGDRVDTVLYGPGIVLKIHRKTAKVKARDEIEVNVPIDWLKPLPEAV